MPENLNPERDPKTALTDYFEVLFPGRAPVAEIHAGAVLALLRGCDPSALAEALGWDRNKLVEIIDDMNQPDPSRDPVAQRDVRDGRARTCGRYRC